MKDGVRPEECGYCWNIEDIGSEQISDRHLKSAEDWALPHFQEIATAPKELNITPTYMEVSFSNVCNFKCAYCAPHISSKWMEEINKFGPYPTHNKFNSLDHVKENDQMPYHIDEANPYVEAFWEWWPKLYTQLKVFRITGGEPLLTDNTFKVLDYINQNPRPDMELALNSNLGVPFKLIEKTADYMESILNNNKVKQFMLFTSVDTIGEQAEYIRYGLKYEQYIANLEYLLTRLPKLRVIVMCAFNALSVPRFHLFLKQILDFKVKYFEMHNSAQSPLLLDIPYLRYPEFLSVQVLSDGLIEKIRNSYNMMEFFSEKKMGQQKGFEDIEIVKMHRLTEWACAPKDPRWVKHIRQDFVSYFTEYDKRRGTDFLETFPEMSQFWNLCHE